MVKKSNPNSLLTLKEILASIYTVYLKSRTNISASYLEWKYLLYANKL